MENCKHIYNVILSVTSTGFGDLVSSYGRKGGDYAVVDMTIPGTVICTKCYHIKNINE